MVEYLGSSTLGVCQISGLIEPSVIQLLGCAIVGVGSSNGLCLFSRLCL